MKHAKRNILIAFLAFAMLFTMLPLRGGHAYAEGMNVGTITLDFTQGDASLNGDQLEAFENVMTKLGEAREINYLEEFGYDLDKNNKYDIKKIDGDILFSKLSTCSVQGTWTKDVSASIIESLNAEGKAYCDKIEIIFPKIYDVWIEGTQLNKNNAADFKGDGSVKYDDTTKTLTLNNATLSPKNVKVNNFIAIVSDEDINLVLKGKNQIVIGENPVSEYLYGICVYGNLNISGTGSLEMNFTTDKTCYGIYGKEGLAVDGAKISANVNEDSESESAADTLICAAATSGKAVLKKGASLKVSAHGTKLTNNTGLSAGNLSVDENSILEASANGIAVSVDNDNIAADTVSRGALVNDDATAEGAYQWNITRPLLNYKYVLMPHHHIHLWDAGVVTRKPTATSQGVRTYTCRTCGETKTEAISNAAEKKAAKKAASNINKSTVTAADIKKASNLGATTVTLGAKVKKISKNAFKGTKIKTVIVKTKKLKKASVKKALTGSKVTRIKVSIGKKKVNKTYVKKYKKIFTKKNAGKKVKVSL